MNVRARLILKGWGGSEEETDLSQPVELANNGLDNESLDGQNQVCVHHAWIVFALFNSFVIHIILKNLISSMVIK